MVDHDVESAYEVLSQKAVLWTSTDNMQGVDAFSTPQMAPATPMQAWQKPLHRQESPDAVPSLSLGRSSAEVKAAYVHSNMSHSLSMPAKCGLVGSSTPSRSHSGIEYKEKLLSFSLSKYGKSLDMATPVRNHVGPSSVHRVCAPAGNLKILPIGSTLFSQEGPISSSVSIVDENTPHACKSELITNDAEVTCKVEDSMSPYSPVPGEIANDVYNLYSKLFPSTSMPTAVCLPSSMDIDANSFFGQGGDCRKLLPSEVCRPKPLAQERCAYNEAQLGGGKKLKLTSIEEGATSKRVLAVKEEPVFEEPHDTHELSSHGNACLTGAINSTWKGRLGPYKENVLKDFAFLKSSRVQSENTSRLLGSSIPRAAFDSIVNSGDYSEDVKPIIGLKLSTLPENTQLPPPSPTLCAGELASKVAAWESPVRGNPSVDADWGKFLALSATPLGNTDKEIMLPFQQRFEKLQAFLKQCDEVDPNELLHGLRSLSTAARSGYAVELETRAIHLSIEEGKELKRMRLLNVLGRAPESNLEELGATPLGPRLPVLGATSTLSRAP